MSGSFTDATRRNAADYVANTFEGMRLKAMGGPRSAFERRVSTPERKCIGAPE